MKLNKQARMREDLSASTYPAGFVNCTSSVGRVTISFLEELSYKEYEQLWYDTQDRDPDRTYPTVR